MRVIRKQNSFIESGSGATSRPRLTRTYSIDDEQDGKKVLGETRSNARLESPFFPAVSAHSADITHPSMSLLRRHRTTTTLLRTLDKELAQMSKALSKFQTKGQHPECEGSLSRAHQQHLQVVAQKSR